ncbi:hypothetical protein B9G55_09295 [Saccharibacillus sp. O16]|nr:hypothetical protein B9G55_09295 [Saccharibacillus sp. O16]
MKKTRRLAISVLACLSLAAAALTASAAAPIKVYRDGTEVVTEATPHFVEGQVMVPLSLAGELFGQKFGYDEKKRILTIDRRSVTLAQSSDRSMSVTGTEGQNGMWEDLRFRSGETEVYLPGKTMGPENGDEPELIPASLTGSAQPDTVVLLTQGTGTGVYVNEAVAYTADLEQIPLEEAKIAMLKQLKASFAADGSAVVEVGGTRTVIPSERLLTETAERGNSPGMGHILRYQVEDGHLTATAGIQIGMSEFIGDLKINYTYENGVLQAGAATFTPYDEYR